MVVENNKNSIQEAKPAVSGAATSKHPRLSISKKRVALIVLTVVIIGAIVGLLANKTHVGQKVYAQAAGHKIYKEEVDNLKGKNKVSDKQVATVLADKYLTEAMAKQAGVKVTNQDIEAKYGSVINMQKKSNPYAYQYQVNQLYFEKLQNQQQGVYKGDLLVAHFSRYVPYKSGLLKEDQAAEPLIGNPAAIAADKKYAQDFITNLFTQLNSGKITWNQAIQMEHNDPVVGENAYQTLSHSGPFDTSQGPVSLLQPPLVQKLVGGLKPGQMTKPFVVRVSDSASSDSTAESYFLLVKINSVSGKPNGLSFNEYVAQAKKQLGYKVYA